MKSDIIEQLADYRGVLGWDSSIEIPLFIKDHPIPQRRSRATEITTVPSADHKTGMDVTTQLLFFGAPDILQVSISGFIITPWDGNQWVTPFGNVTYGEIVSMFLEGVLNRSPTGYPQRRDPDYYITPYGQKYDKPIISVWDTSMTLHPKKQIFSATIYLER